MTESVVSTAPKYNLRAEFLANPDECPKCHNRNLYRDDTPGLIMPAVSCCICGWRFEIVKTITKFVPDDWQTKERVEPEEYIQCCVQGCRDFEYLEVDYLGMPYKLCVEHLEIYHNWMYKGKKGAPLFIQQDHHHLKVNPDSNHARRG
jgi:hypothetical protein